MCLVDVYFILIKKQNKTADIVPCKRHLTANCENKKRLYMNTQQRTATAVAASSSNADRNDILKHTTLQRIATASTWSHLYQHVQYQAHTAEHHGSQRFRNWHKRPEHLTPWAVLSWVLQRKSSTWLHEPAPMPAPAIDLQALHHPDPHQLQVCLLGHACVLIQLHGYTFLTDPVWADHVSHQQGLGPKRARPMAIALDQLPKIDAVLLSHNHYDHMDLAALNWLHSRFDMPIFTGLGNAQYLPQTMQVIELDWWQRHFFADHIELVYTPAQHGSGRGMRDQNKALWGGFSVFSDTAHCYFAGDTGYAEHFRWIAERLGAPDIACLPIGAYEPRRLMQYLHMNPEDAWQAHQDLQAKHSMAIHHSMFQLTDEPQWEPWQRLLQLQQQSPDAAPFYCGLEGLLVQVALK